MNYTTRIGRTTEANVSGETVSAYLPNDLPPSPALKLSEALVDLVQVASQSLGRLDSANLMLSNVDLFIYMSLRKKALVSSQLSHVQFETIHSFLDGNGRLGRLLITLILYAELVFRRPLLYLSLYFKTNRQQYSDLLQRVRLNGDWQDWLSFFLTAVKETSDQ